MHAKTNLFYCLVVLLGGCVPVVSLHPLFTEDNLVFEEKLLGTWVNDTTWEFARFDAAGGVDMLCGRRGGHATR